MSNKCATAIDVLALTVTLFGTVGNLKAASGMCCVSTLWAIHHSLLLPHRNNLDNDTQIFNIENLYSISRSSIFTSKSMLVVKPLSALTVCVSVVIVHSASSMGCLNPLTFTGISV